MGTLINVAAVIIGSLIGLLINRKLPAKIITIIFQVMGLFTLVLGISMSLKTEHYLVVIGSLVVGAVGDILLIILGINILEIKQLKILNMIPALVVVVILSYIFY